MNSEALFKVGGACSNRTSLEKTNASDFKHLTADLNDS